MTAAVGELTGALLLRRYRLHRKIGEGGMGVVYETEDTAQPGAVRAAKILRPEFMYNAQVAQRFLDEARTVQRLAHPNVVRVFDVEVAEDQTPFIVMELLDGAPLGDYLRAGQRLPVPQAVAVLSGVLAGLSAAHEAGIVHRDLKPENIVLIKTAGLFLPKILDFGIAKVMDVAGGMGSRTQTGMLLGTPAYMSPEQIRNSKDVDRRSDLFAAGVLFYEMLTGRPAFRADNEFAKLTAVLNTEPEPVEQIDPELARFSQFIAHALTKDRLFRFQTADEMSSALAHLVGRVPSHPPGPAPMMQSATAPIPLVASAAVAVAQVAHQASSPPGAQYPSTPVPRAPLPASGNGTLASARSNTVHENAPQVVIDTRRPSRMIPAWVVVILVIAALFFGFMLGFGAARAY